MAETQANDGPMESRIRGNVLNHLPNGKQFCFLSASQGTRPATLGKQVLVPESSVGSGPPLPEAGTGIFLLAAQGSFCADSGSLGVCHDGIR